MPPLETSEPLFLATVHLNAHAFPSANAWLWGQPMVDEKHGYYPQDSQGDEHLNQGEASGIAYESSTGLC